MELNKAQVEALEAIKAWAGGKGSPMFSLIGAAGSGKSFLISRIKHFLHNTAYTSTTGRAALRLSELAQVQATTLHSILYKQPDQLKNGELAFNTLNSPTCKYLVVDEASMITPKVYEDLNKWVRYYGVRILFVGDAFQLPPVLTEIEKKDDAEFMVFSKVRGAELTEVMRSDDGIVKAATIIREQNKIPVENNASYSLIKTTDASDYAIEQYLADPDDHILITWRNKVRMETNHSIRQKLGHKSVLPDPGEPIMACRNGQGMLNGQIDYVKAIVPGPTIDGLITYRITMESGLNVICSTTGKDEAMDGAMPFIKNWKAYQKKRRDLGVDEPVPITYGYVSSCHKSQGSEWRRASVFLSRHDLKNPHFNTITKLPDGTEKSFGARFLYTSITRAKKQAMLIVGE